MSETEYVEQARDVSTKGVRYLRLFHVARVVRSTDSLSEHHSSSSSSSFENSRSDNCEQGWRALPTNSSGHADRAERQIGSRAIGGKATDVRAGRHYTRRERTGPPLTQEERTLKAAREKRREKRTRKDSSKLAPRHGSTPWHRTKKKSSSRDTVRPRGTAHSE